MEMILTHHLALVGAALVAFLQHGAARPRRPLELAQSCLSLLKIVHLIINQIGASQLGQAQEDGGHH